MSKAFDPIQEGFGTTPPVYPVGWSIKDKVGVVSIKRRTASAIYKLYHSYRPRGRCGWHYGITLDGELVGAISFDSWPSEGQIRGYDSCDIKEVARVCVVNETPNLASCAMSKAQEVFVDTHGKDTELLVTYVHEDFQGSMFKALRGKGWELDGYSPPQTGYSHNQKAEFGKQRWVCEL